MMPPELIGDSFLLFGRSIEAGQDLNQAFKVLTGRVSSGRAMRLREEFRCTPPSRRGQPTGTDN